MARFTSERIAEIRGHLSDLDRRGIPVAAFAREIGVAAWTIYSWKRRFGVDGDEGQASKLAGQAVRADLMEIDSLLPSSRVEIQIGEAIVRVPADASTEFVRAVLLAVKSC